MYIESVASQEPSGTTAKLCAQKKKITPQTSKTMAEMAALTQVLAALNNMNQKLNEARMSVVVFLFLISLIDARFSFFLFFKFSSEVGNFSFRCEVQARLLSPLPY